MTLAELERAYVGALLRDVVAGTLRSDEIPGDVLDLLGDDLARDMIGAMRAGAFSLEALEIALHDLRPNITQELVSLLEAAAPDLSAAEAVLRGDEADRAARAAEIAPPWKPYPVEVLPPALRALALEGAEAIGCDPAFIALPALVACAGAIGLSRELRLGSTWREPAVLWGAIVGESGTAKSPALELAAAPLRDIEAAARREHRRAMRDYEAAQLRYERELAVWKRSKSDEEPPAPDKPPTCARVVAQDTTIEALARLLDENPRSSVIVVRDELAAWFKSWGEYKAVGSSESAKWLELHGARALSVDRVSRPPLYVSRAAVSVVGGVQPGTLRRILTPEHFESGCAARILLALPPRMRRGYRDGNVSCSTLDRYADVIRRLHTLQPSLLEYDDGEKGVRPEEVTLSRAAERQWREYVDALGAELFELEGAEAAAASKLESGAARKALVVALVEAAARGEESRLLEVSEHAMLAGIALARWHLREARRVYGVLGETEGGDPARLRELLEWLRRRGSATASELWKSGPRRYRGRVDEREATLEELVREGLARKEYLSSSRGGRPTWRYAPLDRGPAGPGTETQVRDAATVGFGSGANGSTFQATAERSPPMPPRPRSLEAALAALDGEHGGAA